jgi:hypothetical protein
MRQKEEERMRPLFSRAVVHSRPLPSNPLLLDVLVQRDEEMGTGISQGQVNLRLVHLLLGGLHLCIVLFVHGGGGERSACVCVCVCVLLRCSSSHARPLYEKGWGMGRWGAGGLT